jgi:hypothetical protein
MSRQLKLHWQAMAVIVIIVALIAGLVFFLIESQPSCLGVCGSPVRGVFANSANCSSSLGRCDLVLVNRYVPILNTTGTGAITFNNQTGYLLCAVVELKPNVGTNDSCMLQGIAAPNVGTRFEGDVAITNGAEAAFIGNFTA